ncbi:hypothetical protein PHAMO_360016 [Magnetospirillum molischianum DSM 120]|uniref:Uncharacterized protein n=1 Tax=Magnetospirillum molischianum DSM 120 TaxID=1150626 RepID=H8FVB8_MAGML|nr:hypothetical protein PHAMO_360016 [Magnetospirillum molischianum DSM 120]
MRFYRQHDPDGWAGYTTATMDGWRPIIPQRDGDGTVIRPLRHPLFPRVLAGGAGESCPLWLKPAHRVKGWRCRIGWRLK